MEPGISREEAFVKKNVGGIDKVFRFILGIATVIAGIFSHIGRTQDRRIRGSCCCSLYGNLRFLTPLEGARD